MLRNKRMSNKILKEKQLTNADIVELEGNIKR